MRPAATAAFVTAAALFAPAAAFASAHAPAPLPGATVAQLAGAPTTPEQTTTSTTGATTTSPAPAPAPGLSLGPATAAVNTASDRVALTAYASYLQSLVKDFPASLTSDTAYVAEISGPNGCKSALQPLTDSNDDVSPAAQMTLTAIGEEIGEDLAVSFDTTALDPFSKFSVTLARLKWSARGRNAIIIQRYIDTQAALTELEPSSLCADALLAADDPETVPTATRAFLKQYDKVVTAANAGLTNFLDLLRAYETPAEQKLVTRIATLAGQINRASKADLLASGQSLTTVLETS